MGTDYIVQVLIAFIVIYLTAQYAERLKFRNERKNILNALLIEIDDGLRHVNDIIENMDKNTEAPLTKFKAVRYDEVNKFFDMKDFMQISIAYNKLDYFNGLIERYNQSTLLEKSGQKNIVLNSIKNEKDGLTVLLQIAKTEIDDIKKDISEYKF